MKFNYLLTLLVGFIFLSSVQAQRMAEPGVLGAGLASSYPAYGLSAKYNVLEHHSAQLIVGGASYGFGTSSFAVSGRYIYNFNVMGDSFYFKPYGYAQVSYLSIKNDYYYYNSSVYLNESRSDSTVSFGLGGGVECEIPNFVEGLAFSAELGFISGSFDDSVGGSISGLAYGAGVHYYFDF